MGKNWDIIFYVWQDSLILKIEMPKINKILKSIESIFNSRPGVESKKDLLMKREKNGWFYFKQL